MPPSLSTLDDLARFVRTVLPRRLAIENLRLDSDASVVRFDWERKHFAVKKSLRVFEIKGRKLYATSHSILVQTALKDTHKNESALETLTEVIKEAENFIEVHQQPDSGFTLLAAAKTTLTKMARLRGKRKTLTPPHQSEPTADQAISSAHAMDEKA